MNILKGVEIILGSGSPRRQSLLEQMNIQHCVELRSIEEKYDLRLQAEQITDYLAQQKGKAFQDNQLSSNQIVITADTIVWFEGNALGKPKNEAVAKQILLSLSGKTHRVISSVCFTTLRQQHTIHCFTDVRFVKRRYCCAICGNWQPSRYAGSYGIQDALTVCCCRNQWLLHHVTGLPCMQTYKVLEELVQARSEFNYFSVHSRNFFLLKFTFC